MKEIRIGVVGLNMGVCTFPLNHDSSSRLRVTAVCSRESESEAAPILKKWGIDQYTSDCRELISRPDVDVVAIFSPDKQHAAHVMAAAEAGKHVVVTKPFTDDAAEARSLVGVVRKSAVKVLVGQTMRFEPQFVALHELYRRGTLGRLNVVEAHYVHDMREMYERTPWRLEKKWLIGAGCHPIDVLRWFTGEIDQVHAFAANGGVSQYSDLDNFVVNVRASNGILARILLLMGCAESPESMMKIGVFGTAGGAFATHTDNRGGSLCVTHDGAAPHASQSYQYAPEFGLDRYGHTNTILRMMKYFETCLVSGEEPRPNAEDGAMSIVIAECIRESVETARPVSIPSLQ